ncbi:type II CAAX endopeptidase family protein [uncultured Algibacter sp.]|uniref:CPBP family intramembrane glutamic endopeptidase n=1 Tax=uncultured Algibacter sp. TaxID=298659 RepID=UPI00261A7AB3|nr:type II CAAX endopeptidase family protein [uncultured Algibacter sp.]
MNFIQQAYKGDYQFWKYLLIPLGFLGLMVLNFVAIKAFNLDVDKIIQSEIDSKGENRFLVEMLLPFAVGLALLFLWVKFIHKQSLLSLTTARKKVDWKRFWFIFFLWGIVSSSFVLLDYYMSPEEYQFNFNLQPFLILVIIAILLIPLQTSFEEYLFRGYLMQGIGVIAKNKWVPLLITSLIFGLMHIANPEVGKLGPVIMVYYIGTGLFLGIITLMDDGLELALGFHAANNLFTALLVTADWTAFQTHSVLKDLSDPSEMALAEIFVPVFVVFPILLFILAKKYNWSNWKDKLLGAVIEPPKEDYKILDKIL